MVNSEQGHSAAWAPGSARVLWARRVPQTQGRDIGTCSKGRPGQGRRIRSWARHWGAPSSRWPVLVGPTCCIFENLPRDTWPVCQSVCKPVLPPSAPALCLPAPPRPLAPRGPALRLQPWLTAILIPTSASCYGDSRVGIPFCDMLIQDFCSISYRATLFVFWVFSLLNCGRLHILDEILGHTGGCQGDLA